MWRLVIRGCLASMLFFLSAPSISFSQNYALQFDGVDDFVEVVHHSSFDWGQEMTIEARKAHVQESVRNISRH